MPSIALDEIQSAKITRKINQVGSFEITALPSVTDLEKNDYFSFDFDGFPIFIGILRSITKDRKTTLQQLYGESAACRLKDRQISNPNGSTYNSYSADIINSLISQCYLDSVSVGQFQFNNVDCGNGYYFPSDAPYFMPRGTSYLSHINTICLMNNWNWYESFTTGASPTVTINIKKNLPGISAAIDFTVNSNFIDVKQADSDSKRVTSVLVPGINWNVAESSATISLNSPYIMQLPNTFNESRLSQAVSTSTTRFPVKNINGYPSSGNVRVWTGTLYEDVQYLNKDTSNLITAERNGIYHYPGDPVLLTNLSAFSLEVVGDVPSGSADTSQSQVLSSYIQLGSEVAMVSGNQVLRYYGSYPHRGGTWVSKWQTTPHGNSGIGIAGLKSKRVDSSGLSDRDHLDKLAQGMLKRYSGFYIGSTAGMQTYNLENFTGRYTDVWLQQSFNLGDTVYVTFADSETHPTNYYILSGVTFNWPGIMDVELGIPNDFVIENIASTSNIADAAVTQPDKDEEVPVIAVSTATSNVAYVQKSDGTYEWVVVR